MKQALYTPPINPAKVRQPGQEVYARMGEANIYRMLEDFYRELETSEVRDLFPEDMLSASQRSAAFFVQLLGGPPRYQELYGPPHLRARHLPFEITMAARDAWLACFERVLEAAPERYGFPAEHLPGFRQFLAGFSLWMVNSEG
jgi:hemoglobin